MGKAGKALKEVLETHNISQNRLAEALGIGRSNVYRWLNEIRDPTAETVVDIVKALKGIEPAAAEAFVRLYIGDIIQDESQP